MYFCTKLQHVCVWHSSDKETINQLEGLQCSMELLQGSVDQLHGSVEGLEGAVEELQGDIHLCCNETTGSFHNPAYNCSHIVYSDPNATSGTCVYIYIYIRESVDSLCRDGADRTRPFFKIEWLITPKRGSYKPF